MRRGQKSPHDRAPIISDVAEHKIRLPFKAETPEALIQEAESMDFSALARSQLGEIYGTHHIEQLGAPDVASVGQSDLQLHYFAVKTDKPQRATGGFVPIAQAINDWKNADHKEAPTATALWRLADRLRWSVSGGSGQSVKSLARQQGLDFESLPTLI